MKVIRLIGIIIILIFTAISVTCKMFAENVVRKIKNKFSTGSR